VSRRTARSMTGQPVFSTPLVHRTDAATRDAFKQVADMYGVGIVMQDERGRQVPVRVNCGDPSQPRLEAFSGRSWVAISPPQPASVAMSFDDLTDTPPGKRGHKNKALFVRPDGAGLHYRDLAAAIGALLTFLGLKDTPSSYADHGGQAVRVKLTEDGLEFTAMPSYETHWDFSLTTDSYTAS